MERVMGIEPTSQPWEGRILPMNYTRRNTTQYSRFQRKFQLFFVEILFSPVN